MFCFRGMGMILKDKQTRASCVKELWEALVRSSLSFIPIPLKQNILFLYTRMIFEIKKGGQLDPCWQIILSVKRLKNLSTGVQLTPIFKFAFQGKFLPYDRIVTEILLWWWWWWWWPFDRPWWRKTWRSFREAYWPLVLIGLLTPAAHWPTDLSCSLAYCPCC